MLLDEYFTQIKKTVCPRELAQLGVDENLQIAFQNQKPQLHTLVSCLKDVNKTEGHFTYGKSQCIIDIRTAFTTFGNQSVINPKDYNTVVNFFHAYPLKDYDSGVMDMRTVALECITYGIQKSLPVIVYYCSPSCEVFIPRSRKLLRRD